MLRPGRPCKQQPCAKAARPNPPSCRMGLGSWGWWRHLPSGLVPSNIVDDGSCSYISNDWNISAGSAQLSSAAKRHRWTGHDNDDFQNNRKYQSHCLKCNQNCGFPEQPQNPHSQPTMAIIDVDLSIVGPTFGFFMFLEKTPGFYHFSKSSFGIFCLFGNGDGFPWSSTFP